MDYRTVKTLLLFAAATCVAAGCGSSSDAVPAHSVTEQKAINDLNAMSPQQRIDMIEKGPMPPAAKAAMIQKIKDKSGTK